VFYRWGAVIVPLGYTDDVVHASGGNPYGTSWPAGFPSTPPDDTALACARFQGARPARFTTLLAGLTPADGPAVARPAAAGPAPAPEGGGHTDSTSVVASFA
jgi:hypothetical protein